MQSTLRRKFSKETMEFRALGRDDKFKSLLELCEKLGHIPRPYNSNKYRPTQYEKVRAQFFVNMLAAKSRNQLNEHDLAWVARIEAFCPDKLSKTEKVDLVYDHFIKTNKLPTSDDDDTLQRAWNYIKANVRKIKASKVIEDQYLEKIKVLFNAKKSIRKPLKEKLSEILAFSKERGRTPKQHSLDATEKHLADALSSIKQRIKRIQLQPAEKKILDSILQYAPPPRRNDR